MMELGAGIPEDRKGRIVDEIEQELKALGKERRELGEEMREDGMRRLRGLIIRRRLLPRPARRGDADGAKDAGRTHGTG
jgi:hypothetical protein